MKPRCVVVGFDGSANARRAVEAAIDVVAEDGTVHVVTAHGRSDPHEVTRELDALPVEFRDTADPLATPTSYLQDATQLLEHAGVEHEGHLIEGHPAEVLLDLAEETGADLIVVGSRGIRRGTRFLHGSVSTRIASHATTSFLVVHHDD